MPYTGAPRAVVPSPSLLSSPDVVAARLDHALQSPGPIGIALYTDDAVHPTLKSMLPTFYVSPRVAATRGHGVRAGWYVIARPGQQFQVRLTAVNERVRVRGPGRFVCAHFCIGGSKQAGKGAGWATVVGGEHVFEGFCERSQVLANGDVIDICRPYLFAKAQCVEDEEVVDEKRGGTTTRATVQLRVTRAKMDRQMPMQMQAIKREYAGGGVVSEKAAAKKGESLSVQCAEHAVVLRSRRDLSAVDVEAWPEVGLTLFIREMFWMQSRCLVDGDGRAYTRDMFEKTRADQQSAQAASCNTRISKVRADSEAGKRARSAKTRSSTANDVIDVDAVAELKQNVSRQATVQVVSSGDEARNDGVGVRLKKRVKREAGNLDPCVKDVIVLE